MEARPWWADVEHLREEIERRRGAAAVDAPAVLPAEDGSGSQRVAGHVDAAQGRRTVKVTGYPERAPHRPAAPPARSDDRRAHLRVITGDAVDRPSHEPVRPHNSARGRTSQEPLGPRNDARGGRSHGPVGSHRAVQRRTSHQPLGRLLAHPDRIALWAVLLGFFLIVVALSSASSDAATHPARSAGAVHSSR